MNDDAGTPDSTPESSDFDLDRTTAAAWRAFETALSAYLSQMEEPDSLVVDVLVGEQPERGAAPYVQVGGYPGDLLRAEVASNEYLSPDHALTPDAEAMLVEQGWQGPSDNWYVEAPVAEHERLAALLVRALREVLDVAHPAFLTAGTPSEAAALGIMAAREAEPADGEEPLATLPRDHEHLVELVDAALVPVFGHLPVRDDDGDIPVPFNSTLVFIRVQEEDPVIELFSFVVRDVTDLEAARLEVGILNRDLNFVKFVAQDSWILAQLQIPSYPFSPMVLRSMLSFMTSTLDDIDDDLALRTGGRRAL
jgi:hypothetical protein